MMDVSEMCEECFFGDDERDRCYCVLVQMTKANNNFTCLLFYVTQIRFE